MNTQPIFLPEYRKSQKVQPKAFTFLEHVVLHRGHPRFMIASMAGAIWAFYFLWMHAWIPAATSVVVSLLLGWILTINLKEALFARTVLGKIMLLHLHPVNLTIQLLAGAYLVYGVWTHSAIAIMAASSAILAGHLWGWDKVHDAL